MFSLVIHVQLALIVFSALLFDFYSMNPLKNLKSNSCLTESKLTKYLLCNPILYVISCLNSKLKMTSDLFFSMV